MRTSRYFLLSLLVLLPACVTIGMAEHQLLFTRRTSQQGISADHILRGAILQGLTSPNARNATVFDNACSIAVAISGGGSLSASFSYGVLRQMAEMQLDGPPGRLRNPLWQIDYLSTASGGGITAALLEVLMREVAPLGSAADASWDTALTNKLDVLENLQSFSEIFISRSYLVFHAGQSSLQRFRSHLPVGVYGKDHACGAKRRVLTIGEAFSTQSIFPLWVPNATSFWDGRRVPLSLPVLKVLAQGGSLESQGTKPPCGKPDQIESWLMTDLLAASMSFPGVGPFRLMATNIPGQNRQPLYIDLIDGGIADNLGINTAFEVIEKDPINVATTHSPKKLLIVLDASPDSNQGMYTSKSLPSRENYLGELPSIFLASQYPEAKELAAKRAANESIELVFIRLQDAIKKDFNLVACSDLTSKGQWRQAGQTDCAGNNMSAAYFINQLSTSAALSAEIANNLMQLGRLAAQHSRLAEALKNCTSH